MSKRFKQQAGKILFFFGLLVVLLGSPTPIGVLMSLESPFLVPSIGFVVIIVSFMLMMYGSDVR